MRKNRKNFDILSSFTYFVPGWKGCIWITLLFLAGVLIGNVFTLIMTALMGAEAATEYGILVAYPMMFLPPMMYASYTSQRNALFDEGVSLDSNHFGGRRIIIPLVCIIDIIALGYILDFFNGLLPDPPQWLEEMLDSMTQGKFWVNFLSVSIFAPFFEEWLCRGQILRGLLNFKKADGSRGIKPGWAIVISALFFAIIHGNPWQAVLAFGAGCLFGYVYYRTGSLKLTMLMHFVNNTFALVCGHIDSLAQIESWSELFSPAQYWVIFAAFVLLLALSVRLFGKIELSKPQGNCDIIAAEEQ